MHITRLSLLTAVALGAAPAAAEPVTDAGTGLGFTPPAGYTATAAPARPPYTVLYDVRRPDDTDTGCKVGYNAAPQNAGFIQAQLNEVAGTPERKQVIQGMLGAVYEISALDVVEHAGVRGFRIGGTFKPRPGMPERAQQVATVFYMMETPKGRTTIVCVADRDTLDARKADFEALLQGTTLP